MKAAEVYAASAIPDPTSRTAFIERTRESVRATLHQGKDVPEPALKTVDRGRER
jgi:hypothetical protein